MNKFLKKNFNILAIAILVFVVIFVLFSKNGSTNVADLTDAWINAVTVENNPKKVASLFCGDGNLVGTVSQTIRTGAEIEQYFNYFAKLPGIKVVDKTYDISQVSKNVYLNTAFITWTWDGLEKPIIARMSFLFNGNCIFQLHSSALPELNKDLKKEQ